MSASRSRVRVSSRSLAAPHLLNASRQSTRSSGAGSLGEDQRGARTVVAALRRGRCKALPGLPLQQKTKQELVVTLSRRRLLRWEAAEALRCRWPTRHTPEDGTRYLT